MAVKVGAFRSGAGLLSTFILTISGDGVALTIKLLNDLSSNGLTLWDHDLY